ncbi:PilT/PilU family type 4a pilus ATPase [Sulfidibacter corallicola]|uniref:PilT/PilU family type 4a pilus ATPase n=1 Tax=Sulfidibacter corallicola TaxID=2818388 RepID=A0A8A4TT85_SULCO|nr:PilT/PilU family type 4a pilus ATPase [Sulfidibacter corallicola]QTD52597.1 PilT/PilU family type 4a pilus ATPase [Sulfidibacter corallicola]
MNPFEIAPILKRIMSVASRASDIIFSPGSPPKVMIDGSLAEVPLKDLRPLSPYQTEMLVLDLLKDKPQARETFLKTGSVDISYTLEKTGRFRTNCFRQRNSLVIVMRVIPTLIPTFDSLHLPQSLLGTLDLKNGIVLLTGPTGSGKSSTMAALINLMAQKYAYHIITIEDPIEFLYPKTKSMIHQRELGADTQSFANALRAGLRQAPQVIMVGEMRDVESIEIALEAAETGHLIMSTLHTIDAAKTIERIIGVFPKEQESVIRSRFAQTFRFIISQRLLPRPDGKGRVAAVEVLKSNDRTRTYVLKGGQAAGSLEDAMVDGSHEGMQTFDMDLLDKVNRRIINRDIAMRYATNPNNLGLKLGILKQETETRPKDETTDDSLTLEKMPVLGLDNF